MHSPLLSIFEDQSVGRSLEAQISKLRDIYRSEVDPEGRAFVPLADALRRAEDYSEAQRILEEGLGRFPESTSGHVVSAWLNLDQGDTEEAAASFGRVLQIDPKNLSALRGMGGLCEERGDFEGALGFFRDLLRENPLDGGLFSRVRELEEDLSTPQGSLDGNEIGVDTAPDAGQEKVDGPEDEDVFGLSWEHAKLQEDRPFPPPALEEWEKEGEEEEPTGDDQVWLAEDGVPIPEVRDRQDTLVTPTLGEIYFRQGLLGRAEEVFEALLDRDPGNEMVASRLAAVQAVQRGEVPDPEPDEVVEEESGGHPEETEEVADPEVVGVETLAPEAPEIVTVETLAPDVPDTVSAEPPGPADEEAVPLESLAPSEAEVVPVESLAPDDSVVLPIESLAPGELDVVSIEALAPDSPGELNPGGNQGGPGNDPTLNAFQNWLDDL